MDYQKIAVAVDLSDSANILVERAKAWASNSAELHIVHVVSPNIGTLGADAMFGVTYTDQSEYGESHKALLAIGSSNGVSEDHCHILPGRPSDSIPLFVEENAIELLVAGRTGSKGLEHLLFSTSSGLVKNINCDAYFVYLAKLKYEQE